MAFKPVFLLAALLAIASLSFAITCAADAYEKACAACSFDSNGKIDSSCKSGYQASGTTCVSTSFPIMSAAYAQGKCPEVDACAAELESCTSQYSTGNDKTDCSEGSMEVCYKAADSCTQSAARKCGELKDQCPSSSASFILLIGASLFFYSKQKQE